MENNFGKLINELRNKKGLTQKELAEELHVSDKTISRWETGSNLPDFDMLRDISKYFKVSLNDLVMARAYSDNPDDVVFQDIIKEFTKMSKRKSRIIKIILLLAFIIFLFLIGVVIFSNSYNRFKVYKVSIDSNDFYSVEGMYVETKIKDSLYLSNIVIRNYKAKPEDAITVDLYYKDNGEEYIIQTYNKLDRLNFVNYESYIKIDDLSNYIDKLFIRVTIIDSNNTVKEYKGKLELELDFSNSKIYSDSDYNNYFDNDKNARKVVKETLISNGFSVSGNNLLIYRDDNINVNYNTVNNTVTMRFESNNLNYTYFYHVHSGILEVLIFDKKNTEMENYSYDTTKSKIIECKTGSCNNYDEAMSIVNKYFFDYLTK